MFSIFFSETLSGVICDHNDKDEEEKGKENDDDDNKKEICWG